jgi:hypothetical protein
MLVLDKVFYYHGYMRFLPELSQLPIITSDPELARQAFYLGRDDPSARVAGFKGLDLAVVSAVDMRLSCAEDWQEPYGQAMADLYIESMEWTDAEGYTSAVAAAFNHCNVLQDSAWTEKLAAAVYAREDALELQDQPPLDVLGSLQMLGAVNFLLSENFPDLENAAYCNYISTLSSLLGETQVAIGSDFKPRARLEDRPAENAYALGQKIYDECLESWPEHMHELLDQITAGFEWALVQSLPKKFAMYPTRLQAASDLERWAPEDKVFRIQRKMLRLGHARAAILGLAFDQFEPDTAGQVFEIMGEDLVRAIALSSSFAKSMLRAD